MCVHVRPVNCFPLTCNGLETYGRSQPRYVPRIYAMAFNFGLSKKKNFGSKNLRAQISVPTYVPIPALILQV